MTIVFNCDGCRNANFPDDVPAGREMDALIAEALGWHHNPKDKIDYNWYKPNGDIVLNLPHFSTGMIAAMEVEARMPHFVLRRLAPTLWQCQSRICNEEYMSQPVWKRATAVVPPPVSAHNGMSVCDCCFAEGDTPMLAICRAALKAVSE